MSNRIKSFRELRNISQSELANKLGLSQKKISQLENCLVEPSLSEVQMFMTILKCSFEDLFIIEEESMMSRSVLIKYVQMEDHVDPNFTYLTYGDMNKRATRLKNLIEVGSFVFFHTSFDGKEYITGYYNIEKILEKGINDDDINSLNCNAKVDEIILLGNREKSKILTFPLHFDRKLAIELKSLGITEQRFEESYSSELSVISNATREHRELSSIDVEILLNKCKGRG